MKMSKNILHFATPITIPWKNAGADPGFQVRGGGAFKKIAPSGGRREHFWGISCENSRFYAKKSRLQNLPPTPNLQF
jgi:hypothetical protein